VQANLLHSPVYGVIFLFKYLTGEKRGSEPPDGTFDHAAAESIFFAAQTIQNACGTQALLSVLLNQDSKVDIGAPLTEFKEFTAVFPSEVCWMKQ
jgi:ubiquitin carboxyl-terminal hydrolase L5